MLVVVDASCQCDNDRILDALTAEVVHILFTVKHASLILSLNNTHARTLAHTHPFYGPLDFVWDYLVELVPER